MRELLFKNITSENKKRKDLYVSETFDNDGITTTTQRRSTYIMGACNKFKNLEEILEWKKNIGPNPGKRHIFIIKTNFCDGVISIILTAHGPHDVPICAH